MSVLTKNNSNDIGLAEPRPARRLEFILGAATAIATLSCIVVPRISPIVIVSYTMLLCIFLMWQDARRGLSAQRFKDILFRPEVLFVAWILIACLWSVKPLTAFFNAFFLAALIVHILALAKKISEGDVRNIEALSRGLLAGFLLGGLYISFEIENRDALVRFVLTHFPQLDRGVVEHGASASTLSGGHIPRVALVYCLLWCPAILSATLYTRGFVRWLCYGGIAASSLVVLLHPKAQSQTAQLTMFAAIICLALAVQFPRLVQWMTIAGFVAAVFLIVPASSMMFAAGLHKNGNIFSSARARIIIWNYTTERILERPIFGVGTYSTRPIHEERAKQGLTKPEGLSVIPATRAHPHNVYLQIWYELGAIGALAFAVLGVSILQKISSLPKMTHAFAVTQFAVCMIVIVSSYGLWQNWFQSAIVLSILALITVSKAGNGVPSDSS